MTVFGSGALNVQNAPLVSLDKYRRAIPEVWFRIVHVSVDNVKSSVELRDQTVEIALGPEGAFENGNIGVLMRRVPFNRVVSAIPTPRHPPRPPEPPREPRTPPVVETLRKALTWRQELDSGTVAKQVDIARREGVTRARVTQVLMLLRLAPKIQEHILGLPESVAPPRISERILRPIAVLKSRDRQVQAFQEVTSVL
ncbi:MAG: hypothetical protein V1809_04760 [Planctomycetota bacterium]